jgi:transcription antitermination protein NusB
MGRRSKARECAFQMLYQWEQTHDPIERVANLFWKVRSSTDATKELALRLVRGSHAHVAEIDAHISRTTKNWKFERIAAVDRNILRLGTYELMMEPETPATVVIDEAVEIAKRFGEADSPRFVNGVLDAIMREVRGGGAPKKKGAPRKKKAAEPSGGGE